MPVVIIIGSLYAGGQGYALLSLIVALLSLVLFICGFESKSTGTRRLVIVSIMVALSAVGRLIPVFKPVTFIVVITGVTLGPQAGFLTGAFSAVISNITFGQGPWTPFQMFAWGMIGFVAGLLSKPLTKSRISLIVYLVISGVLYSLIMDVWTVLWYEQGFVAELYKAAVISAIPVTAVYSVSNVIFALLLAKPMCDKLNRVKIKYGV
ncbi:MAG: ECF transporter S component [Clostridiales bacterium]|nr:ECF transporter S component [Clostridia bacterium]MCR4563093.1 ECF transporter S component [Clostridiales bacterium]